MKKTAALVIVLAVAAAAYGLWRMASSVERAGVLADAAVGEFHARFGMGDDADIFNQSSQRFKDAVPLDKLRELNTVLRAKLGAFQSAERNGLHLNANNGDATLEVSYTARYASGTARESFTFDYNGDLPTLLNFHIESAALNEE